MTVSSPPPRNAEVNVHAADSSSSSSNDNHSTSHASLHSLVDTLFVWDFDWTIVNCNSDEYVPAAFLGVDVSTNRLQKLVQLHGPTKWHDCVASLINNCMDEIQGCTMNDISNAAASMPYLADVRGALVDIDEDININCGQAIISDGNDLFIGAFVKANRMDHLFTHGIETNIGKWIDETNPIGTCCTRTKQHPIFSVMHQSSKYGGHSCTICPPNLCKTQVLLRILSSIEEANYGKRPRRIVYIGDGENDACPALHVLKEGDVLLARVGRKTNDPNSKMGEQMDDYDEGTGSKFGIIPTIEKRQKEDGGIIPHCYIRTWSTGIQLRSHVRGILKNAETE